MGRSYTSFILAYNLANDKLVRGVPVARTIMERLRHRCHTEDRKVLVSIDRLDLCKASSSIPLWCVQPQALRAKAAFSRRKHYNYAREYICPAFQGIYVRIW